MAAINIDQVRAAIRASECYVPDFTTRGKTSLLCSKVYISIIDGDKLRFVELNALKKAIRYITFGTYYSDTVFADKTTMNKVKDFVHKIRKLPVPRHPITKLMPLAQTKGDIDCLCKMLTTYKNSQDRVDVQQEIQGFIVEMEAKDANIDGFSNKFLSKAISFVSQNPESHTTNAMLQSILDTMDQAYSPDEATLNKKLLNKIFGDKKTPQSKEAVLEPLGDKQDRIILPNELPVPDSFFTEGQAAVDTFEGKLGYREFPKTILGYLEDFARLEGLQHELRNLPYAFMTTFLQTNEGKAVVADIRKQLTDQKAHPVLIAAYVGKAMYVYQHCFPPNVYEKVRQKCNALSQQLEGTISICREWFLREINSTYEALPEQPPSKDSFVSSCQVFRLGDTSARQQIVRQFEANPQYRELIEERISGDAALKGMTYEQYCMKIQETNAAVGHIELMALSRATDRPIIVVEQEDEKFKWKNGFNFGAKGGLLIFNFDSTTAVWRTVWPRINFH